MIRRWIGSMSLLVLLGAIALIAAFIGTQFSSLDEHAHYSSALRSLSERSETLNANILRLRFGYINNYDPLVTDLRKLKLLHRDLSDIPSFIRKPEAIQGILAVESQVLTEIETALEHLKTNNATLNNSLRFFPERATTTASLLEANGETGLATEINDLVRRVLLLNIGSSDVTPETLAAPLDRLSKTRRDDAVGREIQTLLAHAKAIVAAKPEVDKAVHILINSPLHDLTIKLQSAYSSAYDLEVKHDRIYWICLIPITSILLLTLAFVFQKLRKSRDDLRLLNASLEERIQERTRELEENNQALNEEIQERHRTETELKIFSKELEACNRELKETQHQLIQSQKLEAVGQLAAGIAHEINTPTQFIGDNLRFLQGAFSSVMDTVPALVRVFADLEPGEPHAERVSQAKDALQKADLEYFSAEAPLAIAQALEGIDRIAKIVMAMKEFSHPGTNELVPTNINRAIETTVTVARNEWRYVAELSTDFDRGLPPVPVLPGEFNQVMLNMIVNASHAIGERIRHDGGKGHIDISTRLEREHCVIRVKDTGCGIPEAIRHRIFDPFFTTKDVGKGTGQGLAISRHVVVEKHGGSIEFDSLLGVGTTFIIRLPLSNIEEFRKSA